jgi:hypothetical protein
LQGGQEKDREVNGFGENNVIISFSFPGVVESLCYEKDKTEEKSVSDPEKDSRPEDRKTSPDDEKKKKTTSDEEERPCGGKQATAGQDEENQTQDSHGRPQGKAVRRSKAPRRKVD